MIGQVTFSRRGVLAASSAAGAAMLTPQAGLAASYTAAPGRELALYNAGHQAAAALARSAECSHVQAIEMRGDRVWFSRALFADERVKRVFGAGSHADYMLVSDAARQAGFRHAFRFAHEASPDWKHQVLGLTRSAEAVLERSGSRWPQALVAMVFGGEVGAGPALRPDWEAPTLYSWLHVRVR